MAPITVAGSNPAVTLSHAEALAGITLVQLVTPVERCLDYEYFKAL